MIKTIKIGNKEVTLSNNVTWTLIYRNQFNKDILPTLTPAIAAIIDFISAVSVGVDEKGQVALGDVVKLSDEQAVTNAMIHASGLEFVDFLNVTWAMAKAANDDIQDPEHWYRDFDTFPLDEVFPKVGSLIVEGLASTKNLKRLQDGIKKIRNDLKPLTQTQSSSQQSSEDSK